MDRAERWSFSSICQDRLPPERRVPLAEWPVVRRRDWVEWVNRPQTAREEEAIRRSVRQGKAYGSEAWVKRTAEKLRWHEPLPRGRPRTAK